jgi:N6-adenosine-specific RNA methylase IME4
MSEAPLPAVVVSIDPAWQHDDPLGRRGAAASYGTMSTDELCAMPLPERAERNVLVVWTLENMTPDALRVVDAWGYVKLAAIVWKKLDPCRICCGVGRVIAHRLSGHADPVLVPAGEVATASDRLCPHCLGEGGKLHLGMGTTTRGSFEAAWICRPKNGQAPERLDKGVSNHFAAPMLVDIDGELGMLDKSGRLRKGLKAFVHSHKPPQAFSLLERLYAGPRAEVFGRQHRRGWHVTGNEVGKLDGVVETFRAWPARVRAERLGLVKP